MAGWVYEPWRDNFYPKGLTQKNELAFASGWVRAIEINATFYRRQSPASFAKWRDAVPDGLQRLGDGTTVGRVVYQAAP